MKNRKIGFFALVLAIIFAMVFGACGEAGGLDIPGLDDILNLDDVQDLIEDLDVDEPGPIVDGKTYILGDVGPGGGIIFYIVEDGIIMEDTGEKVYYFEAAPTDLGKFKWATLGFYSTNIGSTGNTIGTGRVNTALILATDADAPAAKACAEYTFGGKNDWFLPSALEIGVMLLMKNYGVDVPGIDYTGTYWSSSQASADLATTFGSTPSGNTIESKGKDSEHLVRPIRVF